MAEEEAEMGRGETDPTKFGMAQVIDMGDIVVPNNTSNMEEFTKAVAKKLNLYGDG
jgi:hypothetical protein